MFKKSWIIAVLTVCFMSFLTSPVLSGKIPEKFQNAEAYENGFATGEFGKEIGIKNGKPIKSILEMFWHMTDQVPEPKLDVLSSKYPDLMESIGDQGFIGYAYVTTYKGLTQALKDDLRENGDRMSSVEREGKEALSRMIPQRCKSLIDSYAEAMSESNEFINDKSVIRKAMAKDIDRVTRAIIDSPRYAQFANIQ